MNGILTRKAGQGVQRDVCLATVHDWLLSRSLNGNRG